MIREYRDNDCGAVIEVWYAASQVATPFLSEEFLADERANIRDVHLPNAETWIFEAEDTVVGFIALIGDEVGAIFVHPERQGQGIGRALMDHAAACGILCIWMSSSRMPWGAAFMTATAFDSTASTSTNKRASRRGG